MNDPISILIVEDEFVTADNLRDTIEEFGYAVAGIASNALDAIDILDNKKVDFAILDMNIHGSKDGVWLAKKINRSYGIPFIFLTAYSDQTTIKKAVEVEPMGYLVKPFKDAEIFSNIHIALQQFNKRLIDSANNREKTRATNETLFVKEKNYYIKINVGEILYIKSDLKYVEVITTKKRYLLRYSLSEINKKLPNSFIQVHRSYIINKYRVEQIGHQFLHINGEQIPLGGKWKDQVLKTFDFL